MLTDSATIAEAVDLLECAGWKGYAQAVRDLRESGRIAIDAGEKIIATLRQERDLLRAALVKVVGVDGRAELEQMEAVMRLMAAPAEDKAATIDAIHALIATGSEQ